MVMRRARVAVEAGRRFRRPVALAVQGIATVRWVEHDSQGIAHVVFDLELSTVSGLGLCREQRMLALDRFRELFPLPVLPD